MGITKFKIELVKQVKPFRFRYEHDKENKLYYFTLYNTKLRMVRVSISEKGLKDETICENKLKYIIEKYRRL